MCPVTVLSSSVFTCPYKSGSGSGSDVRVDSSTEVTLQGRDNSWRDVSYDWNTQSSVNADPSAVILTGVSKSGGVVTFTSASPLPDEFFPITVNVDPSAAGSGGSLADLGKTVTTATGCQAVIGDIGVVSGAVNKLHAAGHGSLSCAAGANQPVTGWGGSGLRINVESVDVVPVGIFANLSGGGNNWDNSCNGFFTATVIGASSFTVPNAACSSFTPNTTGYGGASYASASLVGGNCFEGGMYLWGLVLPNLDSLSVGSCPWVYTDSSGLSKAAYPLVTSKLAFSGQGDSARGPFFRLNQTAASGLSLRNAGDTQFDRLMLGFLSLRNQAAGIETDLGPSLAGIDGAKSNLLSSSSGVGTVSGFFPTAVSSSGTVASQRNFEMVTTGSSADVTRSLSGSCSSSNPGALLAILKADSGSKSVLVTNAAVAVPALAAQGASLWFICSGSVWWPIGKF